MLSLDTLKLALTDFLGTTETNLWTEAKREAALNRAIRYILRRYDIPQYLQKTTISFTNGVALSPNNMLRPLKLFTNDNIEYIQRDFDRFDYDRSFTYTLLYDSVANATKMHTYPQRTQTLNFYYIQSEARLVSGSQLTRFSEVWEDAIASKACEFLLRQSNSLQRAQDMKQLADEHLGDAWQTERSGLQGKEDQRLQSVFEKKSLLGSFASFFGPYTVTEMNSGITWVEIMSHTVAQVNYGYSVDNDTLVEITLPSVANIGDVIEIIRTGDADWRVVQGNGQKIVFGAVTTTPGPTGYLESTVKGDAIRLVCIEPNLTWYVAPGAVGNITYV